MTARAATRYVAQRVHRSEIRPTTAKAHRDVLRLFAACHGGPPEMITRRTIDRWLATMRDLAPGTRRTRWSIVRGFLAWLRAGGILDGDPMSDFAAPTVPRSVHRALADEHAQRLYGACRDERDRLIVSLGLQLGLRRGEIARLEVGSFSPGAESVSIDGKGGHQRILPTTAATRSDLHAYLGAWGLRAGPLIRGDRYPGRGVSPDWVGKQVGRIAYDAGIKARPHDGVSTHAMRHHAATAVYQRTRDVLVVQAMLGHESLQTTQIYVRGLDLAGMREAMEGRTYAPVEPEGGDLLPLFGALSALHPPGVQAA